MAKTKTTDESLTEILAFIKLNEASGADGRWASEFTLNKLYLASTNASDDASKNITNFGQVVKDSYSKISNKILEENKKGKDAVAKLAEGVKALAEVDDAELESATAKLVKNNSLLANAAEFLRKSYHRTANYFRSVEDQVDIEKATKNSIGRLERFAMSLGEPIAATGQLFNAFTRLSKVSTLISGGFSDLKSVVQQFKESFGKVFKSIRNVVYYVTWPIAKFGKILSGLGNLISKLPLGWLVAWIPKLGGSIIAAGQVLLTGVLTLAVGFGAVNYLLIKQALKLTDTISGMLETGVRMGDTFADMFKFSIAARTSFVNTIEFMKSHASSLVGLTNAQQNAIGPMIGSMRKQLIVTDGLIMAGKDVMSFFGDYLELQKHLGVLDSFNQQRSKVAGENYIKTVDQLAKMTGKTREEMSKLMLGTSADKGFMSGLFGASKDIQREMIGFKAVIGGMSPMADKLINNISRLGTIFDPQAGLLMGIGGEFSTVFLDISKQMMGGLSVLEALPQLAAAATDFQESASMMARLNIEGGEELFGFLTNLKMLNKNYKGQIALASATAGIREQWTLLVSEVYMLIAAVVGPLEESLTSIIKLIASWAIELRTFVASGAKISENAGSLIGRVNGIFEEFLKVIGKTVKFIKRAWDSADGWGEFFSIIMHKISVTLKNWLGYNQEDGTMTTWTDILLNQPWDKFGDKMGAGILTQLAKVRIKMPFGHSWGPFAVPTSAEIQNGANEPTGLKTGLPSNIPIGELTHGGALMHQDLQSIKDSIDKGNDEAAAASDVNIVNSAGGSDSIVKAVEGTTQHETFYTQPM